MAGQIDGEEPDSAEVAAARPSARHHFLPASFTRAVFRSTTGQVLGRVCTAGAKALAYILIFRAGGPALFGEYSVLLVMFLYCEALLDFGLGEIFVREVCRNPEQDRRYLTALVWSKVIQAVVAYGLLVVLLVAFEYPPEVRRAGMIGGLELLFFAGVLVMRGPLKARVRMGRDALAEAMSVLVFLGLVVLISRHRPSLDEIVGALVVSRAVHLGLVCIMGRRVFRFRLSGRDFAEIGRLFAAAVPLGASVMLAVVYLNLDITMLSKMAPKEELGLYAVAHKFLLLTVIPIALMVSLYPVLSSYWGRRMDDLARLYQQSLDCAVLLGGATFCVLYGGAGFLMGLFGHEAAEAAPALKVLAGAIAVMFVTCIGGPMAVIVRRQWVVLVFAAVALALNATLNALLIPRYGYMGAAVSKVVAEAGVAVPGILLIQVFIGRRLWWGTFVKVGAVAAVSLFVVRVLGLEDSLAGGLGALGLFVAGAFVTRAIRLKQVRALMASALQKD